MLEFLEKSITMTEGQHKMATLAAEALVDILAQASPTDETPLQISFGEVIEVMGKKLTSKA